MPYKLTLSKSERKAIDWAGYRYRHGDELYSLLCRCDWNFEIDEFEDWDADCDIEFAIPEHIAWQISEIIEEGLDCFSHELVEKLWHFQSAIV